VETAFLAYIGKQAREAGIEGIRGEYIPTSKNEPVKDLFQRHGFDKVSDNKGASVWVLNPNYSELSIPEWIKITVVE
jgi:predicted enzyme involved in methoxymalonyl-ACP biosynthesis